MAEGGRYIKGTSADVLLSLAARRIYAAAVEVGKNHETVPALGELAPLAKRAMTLTPQQTTEFSESLNTLAYLFGLGYHAGDLLTLSLALELDERIYAAALAVTGTLFGSPGPRIGSWLSILYPDPGQRSQALAALGEDAPLRRYRLVRVLGSEATPLSQRELCGEPSVLSHVVKEATPRLCGTLEGLAELVLPDPSIGSENGGPVRGDLGRMLDLVMHPDVPTRGLHLHPLAGRDALPVARRVAAYLGRPVVLLDLNSVEEDMDGMVRLAMREARIRHGLAMFQNAMAIVGDDEPSPRSHRRMAHRWRRALAGERDLVLFGTDRSDAAEVGRLEHLGLNIVGYEFNKSTLSERRELFRKALESAVMTGPAGLPRVDISTDVSTDQLASVYRVAEGDVDAIVQRAVVEARLRGLEDDEAPVIRAVDLWSAARDQTKRDMGNFAQLVESNYTWNDLVLPTEVKDQLEDFFNAARRRAHVFEDWGYAKKHVRGMGLSAMFSGSSGTGKTMSAEVVANMLNVNMYRVDLSAVISKWIGETERNLSQIFDTTEGSDSILFFDEADSLFGKRTQVTDSKDRYANMETSYLLQRIETYDGICILSTNLRSNIDEAFLRRLSFGIDFPMPDREGRVEIWRKVFPEETPLDGVDVDLLAERYDRLSGGQIRMIAIGASMLAAGSDSAVTLRHIHRAFVNEMHKVQRLVEEYENFDVLIPADPLRTGPNTIT